MVLAVTSFVAIAAVAAAGARGSSPQPVAADRERPVPVEAPSGHRDLSHLPVPEGKTPVADHQGNLVGYVDHREVDVKTSTFPPLEFNGRTTRLRGVPVEDDHGDVVGYEVLMLGFVDLEEVKDLDGLEARLDAAERIAEEQLELLPEPSIP